MVDFSKFQLGLYFVSLGCSCGYLYYLLQKKKDYKELQELINSYGILSVKTLSQINIENAKKISIKKN